MMALCLRAVNNENNWPHLHIKEYKNDTNNNLGLLNAVNVQSLLHACKYSPNACGRDHA